MKTKLVNLSFPENMLDEMDKAAKQEYRSRSELVREAVRRYLIGRKHVVKTEDAPMFVRDVGINKNELKAKIKAAIEETSDKDVIKSVSLFGSFLHGDNTEKSDIDLLVDLDYSKHVGFFKFIGIKEELEKRLGRKVDLVTRDSLSRFFREDVIKEAEKVYG